MFKYANNLVFWMTFLSILLGLASVNAINSVYALDLAVLYFVVWLAFTWVRSSYALRHHLVLPAPDGVWVAASDKLKAMPMIYLAAVCTISVAACLLSKCWWGAGITAVFFLIGGLSCRKH